MFRASVFTASYTDLFHDVFPRLGNLTCLAHPKDLLVYRNSETFGVIQENVRRCVSQGLKVPSDMVSFGVTRRLGHVLFHRVVCLTLLL